MNLWGGRGVAGALVCVFWVAAPVAARQTADPINCWWRTDRGAVVVGEQFSLTLTCSLLETSEGRIVPDPDRLDPAVLDLAPFEVVDGTRHDDLETPPWRYIQYEYTVRLLADEFFGRDVDIPPIPLSYNVETSGETGTRGRDQLYLLPRLPVRVLSLVPITADDIQDVSPDTFADINRRLFRATAETAAGGVLFAVAAIFAVVAIARAARPRLARAAVAPHVAAAPVLRGCVREAEHVRAETARVGWTAEMIDRALTALRIGGALALGRPVAQGAAQNGAAAQEGQLAIRKGPFSGRRILVSGATTPGAVAARLAEGDGLDPRVRLSLQELDESLRVFATARYSRAGNGDPSDLDAALDTGTRALRRLEAMHRWPARAARALSRAVWRAQGGTWSR